jgi:ketosteroid isomerase-like protein
MNTIAKALCLAPFALLLALCPSLVAAADDAAEVAALHAVDDAWAKAYNAGNVEGLVALYDEHALLMPAGAPAASGTAAIRAYFKDDVAGAQKAGISFALGAKPDGGVSGDWGWVSGTYSVKDKSGKVIDTGKYLSVSRKSGGKWAYVRDTWNSDAPPAAAAPAAPAPAPKK